MYGSIWNQTNRIHSRHFGQTSTSRLENMPAFRSPTSTLFRHTTAPTTNNLTDILFWKGFWHIEQPAGGQLSGSTTSWWTELNRRSRNNNASGGSEHLHILRKHREQTRGSLFWLKKATSMVAIKGGLNFRGSSGSFFGNRVIRLGMPGQPAQATALMHRWRDSANDVGTKKIDESYRFPL